ncbi:MAG: nucleoside-triphosphatase [candidate division Zixibacteria bacterium]|nr:nucleoside-triphosphatase [candidate division Zixibacteria bacterium]MDD5426373.1 nucleoside-triphosphatase [candidate division Zixibacteria bacterium]
MKKNILITGVPGVGKTTFIKKICGLLMPYNPVGFYTEEIREGGVRKGFALEGLRGGRGVLAGVAVASPFRVGKYGVDVRGFEKFLEKLDLNDARNRILVIDEIGKMECFSDKYIRLLDKALASDRLVIATIALKGGGFIAEVKKRVDVDLYEITRENRDLLVPKMVDRIRACLNS